MVKRRRKSRDLARVEKDAAATKKAVMTLAIVGALFFLFLFVLRLTA